MQSQRLTFFGRQPITKRDYFFVFAFACVLFAFHAVAWPLAPGRDGLGYLTYYFDFGKPHPYDLLFQVFRTPLPSFFFTPLLLYVPAILREVILAIMFAGASTCFFYLASKWGRLIGYLAMASVWLQSGYCSLYHMAASDQPTAFFFLVFLAFTAAYVSSFRIRYFFLAGFAAGLLFFSRPAHQLFAVFALLPFLLRGPQWLVKAKASALFLVGLAPFFLGWCFYNYQAQGSFALSRGNYLLNPVWRVWITAGTIKPSNGPASHALADKVASEILAPKLGRSPSVEEIDRYFSDRDYNQKIIDLMNLIDRDWGPTSNYRILFDVALEAIKKYPKEYFGGVVRDYAQALSLNLKQPVPIRNGVMAYTHKHGVAYVGPDLTDHFDPIESVDFNTINNAPEFEAYLKSRGDSVFRAYQIQKTELPAWPGSIKLGTVLNWEAQLYPPLILWIIIFFAGLLFCTDLQNMDRFVLFSVLFCLGHILVAYATIHNVVYQYRVFFDPIFLLGGILGLNAIYQGRKLILKGQRASNLP